MTPDAQSFTVGNSIHVGTSVPSTDALLSQCLANAVSQTLQDPNLHSQHQIILQAFFDTELDLDQIEVDLSGYHAKDAIFKDQEPDAVQQLERELLAVRVQTATANRLQLRAAPITLIGIPLFVEVEARNIAIAWVTEGSGDVWLTTSNTPVPGSEATFSGRVNLETLSAKLCSFLVEQSRAWDVKVQKLRIAIVQQGQDFLVTAVAKLKYGILTAKVTASATIDYDKVNLAVTPKNIKITSTNLLVLVALKLASRKLTDYENKAINLTDLIPSSPLHLTALDLNIRNDELRIQGRMT